MNIVPRYVSMSADEDGEKGNADDVVRRCNIIIIIVSSLGGNSLTSVLKR